MGATKMLFIVLTKMLAAVVVATAMLFNCLGIVTQVLALYPLVKKDLAFFSTFSVFPCALYVT